MKLQELIKDEAKVTALLQKTEWVAEGPVVAMAEDMMFELWKVDHAKAIELWEKHVPYAVKGVLPDFIAHRAIEEGLDFE